MSAVCFALSVFLAYLALRLAWEHHANKRRQDLGRSPDRDIGTSPTEIQSSKDILQHAIDIACDGMAIYDSDLRLVAWNRAYRDIFAIPATLLRRGMPLDLIVRSIAERGIYGQGIVEDVVQQRIENLLRPTNTQRIYTAVSGRVYAIRSVHLQNGGLFLTYSDATEQAQSEEDLEAENETLELRVRERTEQLESLNVELLRAKANADDANISKSRFLAAASHDILQPLSAARLYTASLRERLSSPLSSGNVASLAANVDTALEAVEDILGALLEISQLDGGATHVEITTFDIQLILRQLRTEFDPIALERGLRLTVLPSSLRVLSDRKLVRRLLQNLISNALKYTPQGRVLVGVRRIGTSVRVDVCDTGLGIPANKQGVIFREFERLPAATQIASGAGLGLSIVERLGHLLNHDIALRSELGKGSAFSVSMPRAAENGQTSTPSVSQPISMRHGSLDGLVVAAIDNETTILDGMETLLCGWGCVVATGINFDAITAMLAARHLTPDVIIADYHIDEMNGLAIIAMMRTQYGSKPAVLITADQGSDVRLSAQNANVRVIHKPLKPAVLRSLLAQWRLVKSAAE